MKCLNCGTINVEGTKFCFSCGKEIINTNQCLNQQYNNSVQLMKNQNMTSQGFNQINQQPVQGMHFQQTCNEQLASKSITENNNQFNNLQTSNKKSKNILFILIFIIIIAVIIGIILLIKPFDKKNEYINNESLTDTTSFWLQNNENLYALFDVDGKQLTDFEYTTTSEFVTGISRAINKNGSELISSSGKKILETGKYKYISAYLPVYEMVDKDNKRYLYNSYGKLVRELNKDEEIKSFRSEYKYAMIKSDKEYTIIDYKGNSIIKIPMVNGIKISEPQGSGKENYTSIFYNGISYIIDISKRKVLLTVEDSRQFCVYDINDNNSEEFILRTCNEPYGSQQKKGLKLVRDGKIIYSKESDTSITMNYLGNTVMYTEKETYLLDETGNEKMKIDAFLSYKDYKNYVRESEKSYFSTSKSIEVYVDNVLKEKLNCGIDRGYAEHGVYLLNNCNGYGDGDMMYINFDGTRINDKTYKKAYKFDKNGYATVSEDGEKFYLINLNGEKVSDYYGYKSYDQNIYNIGETENLYYGINKDGTKTIFEVNGKKLVSGKNIILTNKIAVKGIYVVIENNGKYTIHELSKNKDIITVDSMPTLYDKYFFVTENSKKQYYSYTTGKLFYKN